MCTVKKRLVINVNTFVYAYSSIHTPVSTYIHTYSVKFNYLLGLAIRKCKVNACLTIFFRAMAINMQYSSSCRPN